MEELGDLWRPAVLVSTLGGDLGRLGDLWRPNVLASTSGSLSESRIVKSGNRFFFTRFAALLRAGSGHDQKYHHALSTSRCIASVACCPSANSSMKKRCRNASKFNLYDEGFSEANKIASLKLQPSSLRSHICKCQLQALTERASGPTSRPCFGIKT